MGSQKRKRKSVRQNLFDYLFFLMKKIAYHIYIQSIFKVTNQCGHNNCNSFVQKGKRFCPKHDATSTQVPILENLLRAFCSPKNLTLVFQKY